VGGPLKTGDRIFETGRNKCAHRRAGTAKNCPAAGKRWPYSSCENLARSAAETIRPRSGVAVFSDQQND